ncbi:MAG TPA: YggS family pyridoxal phosphate-dependent enzyme [Deltaproteobacteria bacterium]|nr:YggS family pyridoxal phosphate-dependent enzyme [Deltaproteobacteria bacterium]
MSTIRDNVRQILSQIPKDVVVVAAAKTRNADEILQAIDGGIRHIGENYLQESREVIQEIGNKASWHFIGHIQKNKVKHIIPLFDIIETVDSVALAEIIDFQAEKHGKVMPVLIEVNCAEEPQKAGVMPRDVRELIERISGLKHIRVQGLMTMGPFLDDPEGLRPYFRNTRALFEQLGSEKIENVEMKHLSMGMSDSYLIAVQEGATMVRIGTRIFGERIYP